MADNDSYIYLARPLPVVSAPPAQATTKPLSVVINSQAFLYLGPFVKEECRSGENYWKTFGCEEGGWG